MPSSHTRRRLLLLLSLAFAACTVVGTSVAGGAEKVPLVVSDADVQRCAPVRQLGALKAEMEAAQSPVMRQVFAWLFPFGPGWNSVLGTFYISSVPNFILAFIPAQINPNTLNTMTAFATGGLLSDVFLHLVPHSFMGEHQDGGVHFVMVEEKRNILVGLGIFIGFASFFIMEKTLRVLGNEDAHAGHSHAHGHAHGATPTANGHSTALAPSPSANGLKSRGADKSDAHDITDPAEHASVKQPSKLSAYLNLFGDFVHNITDGLAMAASFYSSPLIGATTTLACFAHEIPHEIADYSILVRSGFTKKQAMQSQFLTAVGAFVRDLACWSFSLPSSASPLFMMASVFCSFVIRSNYSSLTRRIDSLSHAIQVGTFMGIGIRNLSASAEIESQVWNLAAAIEQKAAGILGTTVQLADLVIPFVAGGFMYIGAVAVLPTLLEESKSGWQALREFAAMFVGVACMFLVAWNE